MRSHSYRTRVTAGSCERRPPGLMQRYCDQLGSVLGRRRGETALKAAKISADLAAATARDAMRDAQAANRAKSEFLANMSHELRTPLNAIIGFSQLMRTQMLGPIGEPRYLEYAGDICGSAEHLLGLINDILDLARIEAGKAELHEDLLPVDELIESCHRIVRDRAATAGLTVTIEGGNPEMVLWGDERKMKQIVINLLANAVKFTPSGGTIRIRSGLTEEGNFRLAIADTGIGIAAADLDRVLEPFAQADSDLNRRYEGTGLGLPLTRRLTELHGGHLTIASELGRGTCVTVELPSDRVRSEILSAAEGLR